ncbi:hypothetical protein BKA56DRAFT_612355 [Ilyonectria sp. MPI-CAGE-AT-0026]|nr:hypothetical protein BKA56DRAFT_612355 [Ilyonectria sp. MPI-CAGE-AT-0026]
MALSNHAVAKCLGSLLRILSTVKRGQQLRSCRCEVSDDHVVVPAPTKYMLEVAQRDPKDRPQEKRGNTALAIPSAHLRIPRLARVLPDNTTSLCRLRFQERPPRPQLRDGAASQALMDSRALGLLGFMHANHPQLSTLRWPESSVGLGDESSVGPQYDSRWVGSRFSASDASPM